MHLKHVPATVILLLCIVDAGAGQVDEQWIVFDNYATASLVATLATAEGMTPQQIVGSRFLSSVGDRAIARHSPELESVLQKTIRNEGHVCGGYTLHPSLAAAKAEADNPFYASTYLNRPLVVLTKIDQQAHVVPALELVDAEHIIGTIECAARFWHTILQ